MNLEVQAHNNIETKCTCYNSRNITPKKLTRSSSPSDMNNKLERRLTVFNVWSFAFGCVIGWSAFVMPGTVFLPGAGTLGTLIAIEAASLIMLIISYNYSYMIKKFPVSGGQFIYAQRAFGRLHGFICAWFLSLCYLSVIPLNATALNLIFRAVFGDVFQFGFHYTIEGYDIYLGEMILAAGALVTFAFIDSLGVHLTGKIQSVLVIVLLGGIAITLSGIILSPKTNAGDLMPMFYPDVSRGVLAQVLVVAVTAPQSFVGFDTVPQLSEESSFSPERMKVIMDTSIICGGFVYIVLTFMAASVRPEGYSDWAEYVNALPGLSGLASIPTLNAAYSVMGKTGLFFITASVIAAMLTGIAGFYIAASRLLYSMARDEMLPSWFGVLNKNSVPVNAVIFCMVIAGSTALLGRAILGWIFDMASIGAAAGFAYTSLSSFRYALSEKRTDIVIFGIMGFALSLMLALLLLVPGPGLNVSLSMPSYILLVIWVILGAVFYVKHGRRS